MGKRDHKRPEAVGTVGDGAAEAGPSAAVAAAGAASRVLRRDRELYALISIKTVSEANKRSHWAARAKRVKAQREAAFLYVLSARRRSELGDLKPPKSAVVTLTRVAPRTLDGDNVQSALKAIRDGVADALGVNDGDPHVTWKYAQRRGMMPNEYAVAINICLGDQ